jgi:Arc/MetJ-type ribon-helix-helix transcriptional regulator
MTGIKTRFTVDLSEEDAKYLHWLKDTKRIKNYSDVIRPAISDRISDMKNKEGYNQNK